MKRLYRIVILLFYVLVLSGFSGSDFYITVVFERIEGLLNGDEVLLNGNPIGTVKGIAYTKKADFDVRLSIKKEFANEITSSARFIVAENPRDIGRKAIKVIQLNNEGDPLAGGEIIHGSDKYSVFFEDMISNLEEGIEFLKKELDNFSKNLDRLSESEKFKALKEEIARISRELKRAGEEARKKIQKEILPLIKKEMERLRQELQKEGREEEMAPLDNQMRKITQI